MRDRLIELIGSFPTFGKTPLNQKWFPEAVAKLADHLLANGVIVPPCKVGDLVWFIGYEMSECSHCGARYDEYLCAGCEAECDSDKVWSVSPTKAWSLEWILQNLKAFGRVYFTTKEEAESALERSKSNE